MATDEKQRPKLHKGRPPVGGDAGTEAVYFRASRADMDMVRAELERLGAGASLAGWMRDALREKLERSKRGT